MHLIADTADVEDHIVLAVAVDQAFQFTDHDGDSDIARLSRSPCPALCRASTSCLPASQAWMAGSSPAMTAENDVCRSCLDHLQPQRGAGAMMRLSLIHISEPTRLGMISYAV